jgi:hypothetical protein
MYVGTECILKTPASLRVPFPTSSPAANMAHEAVIEVDTSVGTLLTPAILPSTEKTLQLEVGDPERSDYSSSG